MDLSPSTLHLLDHGITLLIAIFASSGFWLYIDRIKGNKDATKKMLCGLAHDRITYLCMKYIDRKFITQDEYENLHDFLYVPYVELGGNGSANRLMKEVDKLPIFNSKNHINSKIKSLKGDVHEQLGVK